MLRLLPPPAVDVDVEEAYAVPRPAPAGRPWVAVGMVASIDGASEIGGVSGPLSPPADRLVFHTLRAVADVILVGSTTVAAEGYGPPAGDPETRAQRARLARWPVARIAVVSNRLDLDWRGRLFSAPGQRPLVVTSESAEEAGVARAREHAEVVVTPGERVDFRAALAALGALGARVVLCEGGARLNREMLGADLVDELCLTIAPILAGGATRPIVAAPPLASSAPLALAHVLVSNDSLFLRYVRREEGA